MCVRVSVLCRREKLRAIPGLLSVAVNAGSNADIGEVFQGLWTGDGG